MPAHFNQENHTLEDLKVAVLKAGLANQEYQKKQEMRSIFKYGTVSPSGLNQDLSFWFSLARALACAATCVARTRVVMNSGMRANLTNLFNGIALYPEEGSIAETSV